MTATKEETDRDRNADQQIDRHGMFYENAPKELHRASQENINPTESIDPTPKKLIALSPNIAIPILERKWEPKNGHIFQSVLSSNRELVHGHALHRYRSEVVICYVGLKGENFPSMQCFGRMLLPSRNYGHSKKAKQDAMKSNTIIWE